MLKSLTTLSMEVIHINDAESTLIIGRYIHTHTFEAYSTFSSISLMDFQDRVSSKKIRQ